VKKICISTVVLMIALLGCSTETSTISIAPDQGGASMTPATSSGSSQVTKKAVPTLTGLQLDVAIRRAEGSGFSIKVAKKYSSGKAGVILRQDPGSGRADPDTVTLHVVVSKTIPAIPSVLGKGLQQARNMLQVRGYRVKVVHQTSSARPNTVISETPHGGTRAIPGKKVTIVVAKAAPAPASNCTPGYSPCLPPASDYDCAGGGGNGPKYVYGTVTVTGSDPYGLDADHDGIGCE
jgi:hypothetical protein